VKLHLHIGIPKTGTTSIQTFLDCNRDHLAARAVLFPQSLYPENGATSSRKLPFIVSPPELVDDFVRSHGLNSRADRDAARRRWLDDFRMEMTAAYTAEIRTVVISSEHLSSRVRTPEEIRRLSTLLREWFDEIHVVVYLREQLEFALSLYSTELKVGSTAPTPPTPDQVPLADYRALLETWRTHLAPDALTVRLFERTALVGGNVVHDFCDAIGLDPRNFETTSEHNASLDLLGAELLRRVNARIPRFERDRLNPLRANLARYFTTWLGRGGRLRPRRGQRTRFLDAFRASNEWVRSEFFPNRTTLFTPPADEVPPLELGITDDELDAIANLFADVWVDKQRHIEYLARRVRCLEDDLARSRNASAHRRSAGR